MRFCLQGGSCFSTPFGLAHLLKASNNTKETQRNEAVHRAAVKFGGRMVLSSIMGLQGQECLNLKPREINHKWKTLKTEGKISISPWKWSTAELKPEGAAETPSIKVKPESNYRTKWG